MIRNDCQIEKRDLVKKIYFDQLIKYENVVRNHGFTPDILKIGRLSAAIPRCNFRFQSIIIGVPYTDYDARQSTKTIISKSLG